MLLRIPNPDAFVAEAKKFPASRIGKLLAAGKVEGETLIVSDEVWRELSAGDNKPLGLGDAIASVANPIAKFIDTALGTKISGCGGCKKRQQALNKIVPRL